MAHYAYSNGSLHLDGVDLARIAADVGTPCYVYSQAYIATQWHAYAAAFGERDHHICFAVKANSNLSILRLLSELGAGFDIVSVGELERVLTAGARPTDVVFSGVGKTHAEIERAVDVGVGCLNLESTDELERIVDVAGAHGASVAVAVRVNPDVDVATHPYIATGPKSSKFGVAAAAAPRLFHRIAEHAHLTPLGIASHIGSQLMTLAPLVDAANEVVAMAEGLAADGIDLAHVDVGGGLGITYQDESPPAIAAYVDAMCKRVPAHYTIVVEPGRSLVGRAGVLLTRVEYIKRGNEKNFAIVDAAMNDLIRPALYDAWHEVLEVAQPAAGNDALVCDIVGPICESGDWLAHGRALTAGPGDALAVTDVGAYGFVMASNYNTRPRPPEVLVKDGMFRLVRGRESLADLLGDEASHLQ